MSARFRVRHLYMAPDAVFSAWCCRCSRRRWFCKTMMLCVHCCPFPAYLPEPVRFAQEQIGG